ncbi:TRAP transporter large permease subunit [Treponema phagedenis]|uniref:Citrate transporter n=2 Tax=Treponema phagedenis TaxID=162 RepID=A0A0B7GTQ9_TREPH|nr:TRAP transporter large permease subunit [Treponema phagedenis]NVP24424.1 TRAP transporter large permease subunit [Treponema phagedenis]QKS92675.1 TRAP transporter large permease subunit [Treponema phagedenis]QLC58638.1 TRAP transporter large permease subunit [Treponema phagedenis]CEM60370.1 Citrate transporter [Treponema phagedenis]
MNFELIIFLVMVVSFVIGTLVLKLPVSISMVIASIIGAAVGGYGFPIRHLVEGTFGYIDTILVIATAMIFMRVIQSSGALDALSAVIIEKFHKKPRMLLCFIMFIIMFPGMITGSSTAAVLSTGSMMAPILLVMGIPKVETASIIAMGAMLGMIAPPVNVPAMIIGGGVDIPYVGFELPLLLLTIPLAIVIVLFFGYKYVKNMDIELIRKNLHYELREKHGIKIYAPIFAALLLMILNKAVPAIPDVGMPFVFVIASLVGLVTGEKVNILKTAKSAINDVLPVIGILMGVGMFIQIMTLTGVRGFIVTTALDLPDVMKYIAMAISIPLFGAVSAYGSASVLGVPFLLSFMRHNTIITTAAISLIASLGDLMPPTALAGIFAAQVVGMDGYVPVLKKCIIPAIWIIIWALLIIVFSNTLAPLLIF